MDPMQDRLDLPITKAAQRACVVTIVMTILSLVFVGLKIVTRARVQGRLGWDDALVTISFLLTIPFCVTVFGQAENGQGRSMREITFPMVSRLLKWLWASILLYSLGTGLAKLSILCQYLRVFIDKRTTIATWLAIVFVSAYTAQATILGIFSCVPINKYWERTVPGTCNDSPVYYYFNAAMNMLINVIIIIIPIPNLLRLNISNHNKYGMIIAFSFGFVGCIMSAIRLYTIARVAHSADKVKTSPSPAAWTAVELHVCIMCACLPSLRPLLGRIFTLRLLHSGTPTANATSTNTNTTSSPSDTCDASTVYTRTTASKRTLPPSSMSWTTNRSFHSHYHHACRLPSTSAPTPKRSGGSSSSVVEVREMMARRHSGGGGGEEEVGYDIGLVGLRRAGTAETGETGEGERGIKDVELNELEHGVIKVTSTSEVYSIRAADQESAGSGGDGGGARSSAESDSRLTRGAVGMARDAQQWGYTCEVSAERCPGSG